MDPVDPTPRVGRCYHCGRPVDETVHTRSSYRVGFYALHTGTVEPVTVARPDDGTSITVLRLVRPMEVLTCANCYGQAPVRAERERLFRPERTPREDPQPTG